MKAGLACLLITATARPARGADAAAPGCIVLEKEGKVEVARKGTTAWSLVQPNATVQIGDKLRTGPRSRATLRWADLSVVRVNELTSMEILPPAKAGDKQQLELRSGATYFFSREKPSEVQFRTPVASGAIRGTEFNLAVAEDGGTEVALVDGAVDLSNGKGATTLASGELGTVEPGGAPKKRALIDAINVIQWALYYPVVVDADELHLAAGETEALKDSLAAYRQGDLLAALDRYPEGRAPATDPERSYHAALLLSVGRVEQAEGELKSLQSASPQANALREVILSVKNKMIENPAAPETGSEWLARSYYWQSRRQLDEALKAARKAALKSPRLGAAWVRVAELEFGFGHTDDALSALKLGLELSPRNAEGLALQGFLLAARSEFSEAIGYFDRAIEVDGALANAWLGRGLVKIRQGMDRRIIDVGVPLEAEGRKDLQTAATLEPQRSILRSYLGKAFSQEHDLAHARKELTLAQTLDPQDPTSWLYLALLNQQANRINEAVADLERSKELNDNRSLFRSRLLLDQDQSMRSANLASIYRDEGMYERSAQEAARAVNDDYGNYSAHLFLANSYDALRDPKLINLRYETPWFSELLLANLLAPVNGSSLSQKVSQQEYSSLFASDRIGLFSSTEYSSHGDWTQDGSIYGVFGRSSFAVDGSYRTERGFRPNNDLEQSDAAVRFKQQLTDKDSIFLQVGWFSAESGDVAQHYYQAGSTTFRAAEDQEPNLLVGYHREWSPGNHTLVLLTRFDDTLKETDSNSKPLARINYTYFDPDLNMTVTNDFLLNPDNVSLKYRRELEAYSAELQQIWQSPFLTLVGGGRYNVGWTKTSDSLNQPPNPPFDVIGLSTNLDNELDHLSLYGYAHVQLTDSLRLSGGVSYDRLHYPRNIDTSPITDAEDTKDQVSPKAGLLWSPLKQTHLRAYYSQSLGGVFFDQSIRLEPVQLAGFNQAYRSLIPESVAGLVPGTRFESYGGGLDWAFEETGTYLLAEGGRRLSDATRSAGILTNNASGPAPLTPDQAFSTRQTLNFDEKWVAIAVNQLMGREWAAGARYTFTEGDLDGRMRDIPSSTFVAPDLAATLNPDVSASLHQVDLYLIYQHRCGFFSQFDAIWSQQSNQRYSPDIPGDDFWQYNIYFGYRFLQRRGEVRLGILNLTDEDYRLNPLTLYNELPRERMLTASLRLNF